MNLILATRRSQLALAQAHWTRDRIQDLGSDVRVELREYVTRGDRVQDVPLPEIGGKGLFTLEIEHALLTREADLAVHSLKDLPGILTAGLCLAAVPEREDPRDVVVLPSGASADGSALEVLNRLKPGAVVGTSSPRRAAQLRLVRPDLTFRDIRGNVDTRLRKLDAGDYDAIILAAAGLRRLGWEDRISAALPAELCIPAPGQASLGIEARAGDPAVLEILGRLNHAESWARAIAERAVLTHLGGGCSIPLGAYAEAIGESLTLEAIVVAPDGSRAIRRGASGPRDRPEELGVHVAGLLKSAGAREVLAT